MHRLYLKIFLWFWVGVVVVSGTVVTLTELTHSRADDDRRWQEKYTPRVHMWARQQTDILAAEGTASLARYVESIEYDPGVSNYVFDDQGHDVLGRPAPPVILRAAASMATAHDGSVLVDAHERFIAEKIADVTGREYLVLVDYPAPTVLNRSLVEFLSADFYRRGFDRATLVRFAAVVAVAGLFCFLLARHIAQPIERLRAATRQLGDEQLATRVAPTVLRRRDELADLGRDFDRMAERIENLVTAQRNLLADVSHALRSPLARLNVALGLIRRQDADARARPEHLDRIELETDRLNRLIGQLLTMARVDSGVDLERRSVFDLGTLVEEVASDADYEARNQQRSVRFDPEDTCTVDGAREMLRGAVENVVRNAVRHTAPHTVVEVTLSCRRSDQGFRAAIQVRDYGPGVPEESIRNLFTPFHRVEPGAQSSDRVGLGLPIAKRAFEVHGGRAFAVNAPEGGFLVVLELPAQPGKASLPRSA
jgi:two-component system sensor histidine kinase CpxA